MNTITQMELEHGIVSLVCFVSLNIFYIFVSLNFS